jgi:hypothetical protein
MEPVSIEGLPENALLLVDSAPIIYLLEDHPEFAAVFRPVFEAHDEGLLRLAVTDAESLRGVAGSNPVAPTIDIKGCRALRVPCSLDKRQRRDVLTRAAGRPETASMRVRMRDERPGSGRRQSRWNSTPRT